MKEKTKRKLTFKEILERILAIVIGIFILLWGSGKILIGYIFALYSLMISGMSSFLIGLTNIIFFKSYRKSEEEKEKKSYVLGVLLILIGIAYTIYMIFVVVDNEKLGEYGMIEAIIVATFSSIELIIAVVNFFKARRTGDILKISFWITALAVCTFALMNTQGALLYATGSYNAIIMGISGSICGLINILLGVFIFLKVKKIRKLEVLEEVIDEDE